MKRIALALALALTLSGCVTFGQIETAFQLGTASVTNPVTKDRLNQMENAIIIVFAGLKAWKSTCMQGLINASCRIQIAQVQIYTRQIPPYLSQLRGFVKTNDQINATVVFNQLTSLIGTVKSQAAAAGANVGS